MSETKQFNPWTIVCPLLLVLFIGLKLTGFISWSWWWVTAPIWLPAASFIGIALGVFVICFIILALIALFGGDYKASISEMKSKMKRNSSI